MDVRPYPFLIRPVAGLAREAGRRRRWAFTPGAAGQLAFGCLALGRWVRVQRGSPTADGIEEFERFGSWADRLWAKVSPQLGTCTIRDADHLATT